MHVAERVTRHLQSVIDIRHRLHRVPELCYEEVKTAAIIRETLDAMGLPHRDGVPDAATATIVDIPGDADKPLIALRADIDALPIREVTGLPYASEHPGRMHACGHDGHAANLLGVAAILKELADELPVRVRLMFQPAEEGGGGARRLVEAGVLDGVEAVFGMHGWPGLPVGMVSTRPGALLAATDQFEALFRGRGGHGAYPHFTHDPVIAASSAVIDLQQVVSREIDPTEPAVITVASFHAGTAYNVIPDTAIITGTARTLRPEIRRQVRAAMQRRLISVATGHSCQVDFTWKDGYPPTVNDPAMAEYVADVAREVLGPRGFLQANRPTMGGEDFAYYLEKKPGCFFLVGVKPDGVAEYPGLHTDRYDFSDAAFMPAMQMMVELCLRWKKPDGTAVASFPDA